MMAKMGENVPKIIDKAVDFMASSQAFMEYLNKSPPMDSIPEHIPEDKAPLFRERLEYYRDLYKPVCEQESENQD